MSGPRPATEPPGSARRLPCLWGDLLALAPAIAAVLAFYFWTATSNAPQAWVHRQQGDYYNLLVDGFRAGHLSMRADPKAWLLDASRYGGHYYLYFGVAPVLTLFLPFRLLTGEGLNPAIVCAVQGSIAFLAGSTLLLILRRRFVPTASRAALAAVALVWGLGSGLPVVLRKPDMYEVAATGGMAWGMVCLLGSIQAVLRPAKAGRWLILASAAAGLTVGSRPNLAVGVIILGGLAAGWIFRQRKTGRIPPGAALRLALAAFGPAAACAAGLMAYNALRFGDPFEFGHRYQVGSNAEGFFSPRFVWHNLRVYYLTPPAFSGTFPFFAPGIEGPRPPGYIGIEAEHGQFFGLLLAVGLGIAVWMARRRRNEPERRAIDLLLAAWFAADLAVLLCVSARADRYALDFHPALVLLACGWLLEAPARPEVRHRRMIGAAGWAGAAAVAAFNLAISFQTMELFRTMNPAGYARAERLFDRLAWPFYRLTGPHFGPLVLDVEFPSAPRQGEEPLVTVGCRPYADTLLVRYLGPRSAQLVLRNDLEGGPSGPPFEFTPGKTGRMTIWMGSLLPPAGDPWFGDQPPAAVQRMKTLARVTLDGREIFRASQRSHDFAPGNPDLGRLPRWSSAPGGRFSGRLDRVHTPAPRFTEYPPRRGEVWGYRMVLALPRDRFGLTEPLIATDLTAAGDVIALRYRDPHSIEILHDQRQAGIVGSAIVPADYARPQSFEVLFDPTDWTGENKAGDRVVVVKDGRVVLREKVPTRPFAFGQESPLMNPMISSIVRTYFAGTILSLSRTDREAALGQAPEGGVRGLRPPTRSFRMELRFPKDRPGRNEPLVAAGRPGSADGLYVRYGSGNTVQFGFDHWGVSGLLSASVSAAEIGVDIIDVDFGSGPWERGGAGELRVVLNGREVVRRPESFYGVRPQDVVVGANPIGFSTSDPVFHGVVLSVQDRSDDR